MLGDQQLEVGDGVGRPPVGHECPTEPLSRRETKVVQAHRLRRHLLQVGQLAVRGAGPQGERLAIPVDCHRRSTFRVRSLGLGDASLEALGVDHGSISDEAVARRLGDDERCAASARVGDGPAQSRHLVLQGRSRVGGQGVGPQRLRQHIGGDHRAGARQEHGEQTAPERAAEVQIAGRPRRRQGAEHLEAHAARQSGSSTHLCRWRIGRTDVCVVRALEGGAAGRFPVQVGCVLDQPHGSTPGRRPCRSTHVAEPAASSEPSAP